MHCSAAWRQSRARRTDAAGLFEQKRYRQQSWSRSPGGVGSEDGGRLFSEHRGEDVDHLPIAIVDAGSWSALIAEFRSRPTVLKGVASRSGCEHIPDRDPFFRDAAPRSG
jgi:hypothetical protein